VLSALVASLTPFALTSARRGLAANPAFDLAELRSLFDSPDRETLMALAARHDLTAVECGLLLGRQDPVVRQVLAANPVAAHHVWADLVGDPDSEIRLALVGRSRFRDWDRPPPVLPEEAHWKLAHDADERIRLAVAGMPDLSVRVGSHLAHDPDSQVRQSIALGWRRMPEEVRRSLLADPDPEVRCWALHREAPPADLAAALLADPLTRAAAASVVPDVTEDLVADPDHRVREAVAGNPHLAPATVLRMADDPDEDVRVRIMLRRDLPDDVRARVVASVEIERYHAVDWWHETETLADRVAHVDSPFVFCRRAVASWPDLPPDAVLRLAADDDFTVRMLLAENHQDTPGDVVAELIPLVGHARWVLFKHPNLSAAALEGFAASDDVVFRRGAATSPNLPAEVAVRLADDPDYATRVAAAENPALPVPEILRLLAGTVGEAAARNPRLPRELAGLLSPGSPPPFSGSARGTR
jgi:leucine rich repeat (LRR) protein